MNAAEQRARHTQLAQLATDTAKAFEDMDVVVTELRKDLASGRVDLATGLAQTMQTASDLIRAEHEGRVHADLDLSLAQRGFVNRGFWARMAWLFLGR